MKVKCLDCGFKYEIEKLGSEMCPKCGCIHWSMSLEDSEKLFNKPEEKIDRESLGMVKDLLEEAYYMARGFLAENEPTMMEVTMRERAEREMDKLDPFHYRRECKRKGLAFEITDIKDGNKIRVRKIYFNGHIEGFQGNPLVTNHILPKIMCLKALLKYMNEDYKDFMIRYALGGLPPTLGTINSLYEANLKRIDEIKL